MTNSYGFWWDVADYANRNWKGAFSPKDVAESGYEFLVEWEATMKSKKLSYVIDSLMEQLHEDVINGSEEAKSFMDAIDEELRSHNVDLFIEGE